MSTLHITICPSCGSPKIKRVRRNWRGQFRGRSYTVPSLEFYECPVCGEKVYDRQAMQRIEEYSPAFAEAHANTQGREP